MKWTESNTVRYLAAAWLAQLLLNVVPMLQNHQIDWWALGALTLTSAAGVLIRIFQPDVVAPGPANALLNKNNPIVPGGGMQ